MASRNLPSFGELFSLLESLGFTAVQSRPHRAYRHPASDTWMVFPDSANHDPARETDIVAVRKQLTERGLISAEQFDQLLAVNAPKPEHRPAG